MNGALRHFKSRSMRYSLRPQDKNVMRFTMQTEDGGKNAVHETLMLNLSQTGVGFLVDAEMAPNMGDRMMVEIPIPSGEQLAWWATVVRLEEWVPRRRFSKSDGFMETRKMIVGLRFEEMPDGHILNLKRGLEDSFMRIMREQKLRTAQYYKTLAWRAAEYVFYAGLVLAAVWFIYWLAQPDANYDAKRGAPWGERFKF